MVKKIIRRKPKTDPSVLTVTKVEDDEGVDYWKIDGLDYYVGFEDKGLRHFIYDPEGETGWEHLPGWAWYGSRTVLLRNFHRFLNNEAPLPKLPVRKSDPKRWGGHILFTLDEVPTHPRFPIVDVDALPPESKTVIRWDSKAEQVVSLLTVDKDGCFLGWDDCGRCRRRLLRCECPKGCVPNNAIFWSCDRAASGWSDERRVTKSYVPTVSKQTTPARGLEAPLRPGTPKAASQSQKGSKRAAEKPTDATVAALDAGTLDLGALAKQAATQADADTKSVRRIIKKKKAKK